MSNDIFSAEEFEPPGSLSSDAPDDRLFSDSQHAQYPEQLQARKVRKSCSVASFPSSPRTQTFRKTYFSEATATEWNDWRWQLRNRIVHLHQLERFLHLTDDERTAIFSHRGGLPLAITPYFASLLDAHDSAQPLRRTVVPVTAEYLDFPGEAEDPLGEDAHSPVPGLVHRYPDRVLFLVTDFCSTYCRYCTRSRMVGNSNVHQFNLFHWQKAIAYIEDTPSIRDVLLSGGDPLTLPDEYLERLISRLRSIPHVEFIRIGTKVPVVLPHRVTSNLTRMLRRYHPLWMSIHFSHPDEITPEAAQACERLADAGIPLGSQTVLLSGVNDSIDTMRRLVHALLRIRVRPYYLYQCDPILGSTHFRTPVEKGLEIIKGLRGFTSGYAVPTYVIDAPGGGGKIPLLPEYYLGRDGEDVVLQNYEGKRFVYPDTKARSAAGRGESEIEEQFGESF
jgi:lysine 2,3-aminomutase